MKNSPAQQYLFQELRLQIQCRIQFESNKTNVKNNLQLLDDCHKHHSIDHKEDKMKTIPDS